MAKSTSSVTGDFCNKIGTKRTSSDVRLESVIGGKADYMCSGRVFRLLTHYGPAALFVGHSCCGAQRAAQLDLNQTKATYDFNIDALLR
jgi:hypothetical protein